LTSTDSPSLIVTTRGLCPACSPQLPNTKRCLCGYLTDPKGQCTCQPGQIRRYMSRISGPLLEGIDIHVEVPALKYEELTSARIRAHVQSARERQHERLGDSGIHCYAQLVPAQLEQYCVLNDGSRELLKMAITQLRFSA